MIIPVSECLSEDGSICGWYGMCSSKGVRMCQIEGNNKRDTIHQRIEFAKGCLNPEQTKALEQITESLASCHS